MMFRGNHPSRDRVNASRSRTSRGQRALKAAVARPYQTSSVALVTDKETRNIRVILKPPSPGISAVLTRAARSR
jgi:hypothetical protein